MLSEQMLVRFQELYLKKLSIDKSTYAPFAKGPVIESLFQAIAETIENRAPIWNEFKIGTFICPSCKSPGPHKEHPVQPVRYGGLNAVEYYSCKTCGTLFKPVTDNKPSE